MRILVVEDDKHIRRILESLLTKEPSLAARMAEVISAADGELGLKALEKGPFDLVITDLLMPHIDGFTFCRELRKHPFGEKVPVIVTSAIYKDQSAQIRLKQIVGEHYFFAKPYEIRDLVKTVNRILDGGAKPAKKDPTPAAGVPVYAERESGSLTDKTPSRVLLDLADRKASGTLCFSRGKVKKEVGLVSGVLVSCDSNLRTETLGHFLVSRGVIDEKQHQAALTRAQAQKERLGQAMIELSFIAEKDLMSQLAAQMRAKVASLLRWREGEWMFSPGQPPAARLQTPIEAPRLVFLGLQKTAHVDEIAQLLQGVRGRVVLTPRGEKHRDAFIRVFGTLGFDALAPKPLIEDLMSGTDPAQMLTHLDALLTCGMATLEPAEVPQLGAQESTDPSALDRITQPTAPSPPTERNLYDQLFGDEISQVREIKPDAEALRKEILTEVLALPSRDHYQLLSLLPTAGLDEITAAYHALTERFRLERFTEVDLGRDYAHVDQLHQAFARAYETLSSPERRAEYDRSLTRGEQPTDTPIDAELSAGEAAAFLSEGHAEEARKKLEQAVAAAPDQADYHAQLGWATFLAGDSTPEAAGAAWEHLERAIGIDSTSAEAHDIAGRIAAAVGDDERAATYLERALDADPAREEALAALETVYTRRSAWKPLERRYRKLIHRLGETNEPLRISLWSRLGAVYQDRIGDPEAAKLAWELLIKLAPDHGRAKAGLAKIALAAAPKPAAPTPAERFREHLAAERWDPALVAASACPEDQEAAAFYRRYRPRFLQRAAPVENGEILALRASEDTPDLGQLFALVFAAQPPAFALGDLGIGAADEVPPESLPTHFQRVLTYAAQFLGVSAPPVYRRGDFAADVSVGAAQPPVLLAGPQALALADHTALAFRLGRALSYQLTPARAIAGALPARQLKEQLLAALSLVTPGLRVEDPDGNIARLRERLASIGADLKRELQPLAERLLMNAQGALNLGAFVRGLARTADRIGLAVCNDLAVALRIVAASGAPGAADELTAWALSDRYLQLREQLGISVAV